MKAAALAPGLATLGQKGHALSHDFVLASLLAVLCLPSTLLKTPVDDHPIPLTQILPAMFGLFAKHDDVDEAHFFLQLIALLEASTGRQAKAGDRGPAGRIPQLRVPGQIPDQDDFIEPRQRWLLVRLVRPPRGHLLAEQAPAPVLR